MRSVRVRVVELPQFGSLHRHLVVPLDVVPFFFICPAHTGHRGLFLLTRKAHQPPTSTWGCHSDGLNTKRADISTKTLYPPDLPNLSSKITVTQTHFLLLNPQFVQSFARMIVASRWLTSGEALPGRKSPWKANKTGFCSCGNPLILKPDVIASAVLVISGI